MVPRGWPGVLAVAFSFATQAACWERAGGDLLSDPRVRWRAAPWLPGDLHSDALIAFDFGNVRNSSVIAAFDYDNTLGFPPQPWVRKWGVEDQYGPANRTVWPVDTNRIYWWGYRDWQFPWAKQTMDKLAEMDKAGSKIVVLSNQFVLSSQLAPYDYTPEEKMRHWAEKMVEVCAAISARAGHEVPMQVLGALKNDCSPADSDEGRTLSVSAGGQGCPASMQQSFSKPCTGMWDWVVARNGNTQVDCAKSTYTGDAAGRTSGSTTSEDLFDFAKSDLQYATNIGVRHFTPEEYFLAPGQYPAAEKHAGSGWCGQQEPPRCGASMVSV